MKKFYYKKGEDSIDKTPIILRLERRYTINAIEDKVRDEQREISSRAASISSLDTLRDETTIPRVRSREVAKSLSEDVLNSKVQPRVPRRVITEAELSSSSLYKSMKASVDSRLKSPNKQSFRQTEDLEPVVLQDPTMKPIPVKSGRSPKRSCLCQFATVTIIGLVTVGFLAAIAGIIYMEIFESKNLTSYEAPETPIDLSELVLDSRGDSKKLTNQNIPSRKEQPLNNSPRKETEIQNTNIPFDKIEEPKSVNFRMFDIEKSATELNQYINSTNTKIKFQDGETVIYEVKPSDSMEYETHLHGDNLKGNMDSFNNTESNSSKDDKGTEVTIVDLNKNLGANLDSHKFENFKEGFEIKQDSNLKSQDSTSEELQAKADSEDSESQKLKPEAAEKTVNSNEPKILETDIQETFSEPPMKLDELEQINSNEVGSEPERNEFPDENKIETIDIAQKDDEDGFSKRKEDMQLQNEVDNLPSVEDIDEDQNNDHDINTMLLVVDDPEEQEINSFLSSRNGDMNHFETTDPNTRPTSMKIKNKHSVIKENKPQSFVQWHQVTTEPPIPKKLLDMKVSLAEAMKHLQVLDVNSKILSSRMKPAKPKGANTKRRKQTNVPQKKDAGLEKKRYLQKVRYMLYDRLQ